MGIDSLISAFRLGRNDFPIIRKKALNNSFNIN